MAQVKMKNPLTGQIETFDDNSWKGQQKMMDLESKGWSKDSPGVGFGQAIGENSYMNDFGIESFKQNAFKPVSVDLKPIDFNISPIENEFKGGKGAGQLGNIYDEIDSNFYGDDIFGGTEDTDGDSRWLGTIHDYAGLGGDPINTTPAMETFNISNDFDPTDFYSGESMNWQTGQNYTGQTPPPPPIPGEDNEEDEA